MERPLVMIEINCASVVWARAARNAFPINCDAATSGLLANSSVTTTTQCAFCGVICWPVIDNRLIAFALPSATEYAVAPTEMLPTLPVCSGTDTMLESIASNAPALTRLETKPALMFDLTVPDIYPVDFRR